MTTCQNDNCSTGCRGTRAHLQELGRHESRSSKSPDGTPSTLMASRALAILALVLAGYMFFQRDSQQTLSLCACLIAVLFLVNAVIQHWHKQVFLSNPNGPIGLPMNSPLWSLALPLTVTLGASYMIALHYQDKVDWLTQFRWNAIAVFSVITSVAFALKMQVLDQPKFSGALLGASLGSSIAVFGLLMCHFVLNVKDFNLIELGLCLVLPLMVYLYHLGSLKKLLLRVDRTKALGAFCTTLLASVALGAAAMIPEARSVAIAAGEAMTSSEDQSVSNFGFDILKNADAAPEIVKQLNGDRFQNSMVLAMVPKNEFMPKLHFELTGKGMPTARQVDTNSTDVNLGNSTVGDLRPGLSLQESQLTGHVDAKSLTSALYWTLVFNNQGEQPEEARCKIVLPPGAAVSRATLWINGKEQEAAFDTREKVQAAYQWIVKSKRDPLLITEGDDGLISLQAYPVPKWGEMKVRFGITAPLDCKSAKEFRLEPPRILTANFETKEAPTNVKLESNAAIASNLSGGKSSSSGTDKVVLRGQFKLDNPAQRLQFNVASNTEFKGIVSRATHAEQNSFITQSLSKVTETPASMAVVIDGSSSVAKHATEIERGLKDIPSSIKTKFFVANRHEPVVASSLADAVGLLQKHGRSVGCDDSSALEQARNYVAREHRGTILWIHGSQAFISEGDKTALKKLMMSGDHRLRIYDFQVDSDEPNQLRGYLQGLDKDASPEFKTVYQSGSVENDLSDLAHHSLASGAVLRMVREKTHSAAGKNVVYDFPVASRMSTLWAAEEAHRLIAQGETGAAGMLGSVYRIVTPVTGAVVLETESDYQRTDLNRNMYGVVSDKRLSGSMMNKGMLASAPASPAQEESGFASDSNPSNSWAMVERRAETSQAPMLQAAAPAQKPSLGTMFGDAFASQGAGSGGGPHFGDAYSSQGDVGIAKSDPYMSQGDTGIAQGDTGIQNQNSNFDFVGAGQRVMQGFMPPTPVYGAAPTLQGTTNGPIGPTLSNWGAGSTSTPVESDPVSNAITFFQAIAMIAGLWLVACGFFYKAAPKNISSKLLVGSALLLIGIALPHSITWLLSFGKSFNIL